MNEPHRATHVVVDTDVTSWLLDLRPLPQAEAARRLIGGRARVVSFTTVTELWYGALRGGWGEFRLRRLERSLTGFEVVHTNERLINRCAMLWDTAARLGHGLAHKVHEADRWVAATALSLELELVAGDAIYEGVPGLEIHRVRPS